MNKQTAGGLVWTTRILAILAFPPPLLELLGRIALRGVRIPSPTPGSILDAPVRLIFGIYTLYWFLLWVSGKIVCAVLATLTIIVALQRGVDQRTKALTVAAGSATCLLLMWWVNFIKHQW